jgi:hypothetical protein
MGQTESEQQERYKVPLESKFVESTFNTNPLRPLEEIDENKGMSQSRLLHSRTSFVKRCS